MSTSGSLLSQRLWRLRHQRVTAAADKPVLLVFAVRREGGHGFRVFADKGRLFHCIHIIFEKAHVKNNLIVG